MENGNEKMNLTKEQQQQQQQQQKESTAFPTLHLRPLPYTGGFIRSRTNARYELTELIRTGV